MNEGEYQPKNVKVVEKNDVAKSIWALSIGKEIWITPSTALEYFEKLVHEIGHTLGRELSFKEGDVLSPDEVLVTNLKKTSVMKGSEIISLFNKLKDTTTRLSGPDEELNKVIFELVRVFAKGKFDQSKLIIHTGVSEDEIIEKIKEAGGAATTVIDESGHELQTNTKHGRNMELTAITTQIACRKILQNTFRDEGITFIWKQEFDMNEDPSHFRATRIVERAFKGKGWKLPSIKELQK